MDTLFHIITNIMMMIKCVLNYILNRNLIKKEVKKGLKYADPTTDIQCMWNVKKSDISYNTSNWTSESFKQPYWETHTYFGQY